MSRIACALGAAGLAGSVLGFVLVGEGPDAPHAASAVRPVEQATRVAPAPELAAPQGWMEARSLAAVTPASAPSAAALGRAPATTTVAEGAAEMGRYLATPELRGAEAIALGRAVAQDPEMAALLTGQAAAWRGSPEPSLRARGLLLEASLGRLDALGWQQAVAAEADPAARALMVANPPTGASAAEDACLTAGLLDVAQGDADAGVRRAALDALPRLEGPQAAQVVAILQRDPDPAVRTDAARHLRAAPADPTLASGLLVAARRPDEAAAVRRAAALALIRMEERAPGTLTRAGGTREQIAEVLGATAPDRG